MKPYHFTARIRKDGSSYVVTIPSLIVREMFGNSKTDIKGKTVRVEVTL